MMTALKKWIKKEREELHRLVALYGFMDPRTQDQSRQLDRLIVIEQKKKLAG